MWGQDIKKDTPMEAYPIRKSRCYKQFFSFAESIKAGTVVYNNQPPSSKVLIYKNIKIKQ